MASCFEYWRDLLSPGDFDYLIRFIENVKYNKPNDKMIVIHSGRNLVGKPGTLKSEIISYLGKGLCGTYFMSGEIIYNENIKRLAFLSGIDEVPYRANNAIINLIKYKQSFIAETDYVDRIDERLFPFARVILIDFR
jgi:hypothetical protein